MSFLNQTMAKSTWGIRGRLLIGFAFIAAILLIAVATTLVIVTTTKNFETIVLESDLPTYNAFLEINKNIFPINRSIRLKKIISN